MLRMAQMTIMTAAAQNWVGGSLRMSVIRTVKKTTQTTQWTTR